MSEAHPPMGSENREGPSAASRQRVALGPMFKAFRGLGFLVCKVGPLVCRGRSPGVRGELRLTGLM